MRENRPHGSEGGGARAFPTPIGIRRRQAGGKGEGFEGGGGGIAGPVFQAGAHSQRPEFMKAGMHDAEGGVIGSGDSNHGIGRPANSLNPNECAVLGYPCRGYIT